MEHFLPDRSHIPVILFTAKASEEYITRGLESSADDYVTKPFNMDLLRARIKNLIILRSRLQEKMQNQLLLQPVEPSVTPVAGKLIQKLNQAIEDMSHFLI